MWTERGISMSVEPPSKFCESITDHISRPRLSQDFVPAGVGTTMARSQDELTGKVAALCLG